MSPISDIDAYNRLEFYIYYGRKRKKKLIREVLQYQFTLKNPKNLETQNFCCIKGLEKVLTKSKVADSIAHSVDPLIRVFLIWVLAHFSSTCRQNLRLIIVPL